MNTPAAVKKWLGLNWQISPNSGWGILGFNLAVQADLDGRLAPTPLVKTIYADHFPPRHRATLDGLLARERTVQQILTAQEGAQGQFQCEFPVLHSLGNWFGCEGLPDETERIRGLVNLAIIFLEETKLRPQAIVSSAKFERILAGSTWNKQVLLKQGITNVETFLQGVDAALFHSAGTPATHPSAFRIFSGGKLEFRKSQDIVIAAFRQFQRRHPDALLMMAWHNPWPKSIAGIERRGHVTGLPAVGADGRTDLTAWLEANGVPRSACHDFGAVPNHFMPRIYAQADVAVFPNRCEGGTNLVAMESMASGLPTILSANTGHLDLIDERHCYPLWQQGSVEAVPPISGTEGWGESSVEELVEALEKVYLDRAEARKRGAAAAQFMKDWSWEKRFEELVGHLRASGCPV